MSEIKFTKTELRTQQLKLERLKKYLPTLQLKKAMLQTEINLAQSEIDILKGKFSVARGYVERYAALLTDRRASDLFAAVTILNVEISNENIAGVDIPIFQRVRFASTDYSLFDTPIWFESALEGIKKMLIIQEQIKVIEEKKRLLDKELREVSIRVNLFEKILIPRAQENIKKIKIFLSDRQLAAVSEAKVAKKKIQLRSEGVGHDH